MIEIEYNLSHGSILNIPNGLYAHLPPLYDKDGNQITNSGQNLMVQQNVGPGSYQSHFVPDLFVGVKLIDEHTMLPIFRIVTLPNINPYQVMTELNQMKRPNNMSLAKHNWPFAILPLIIPS